MPTTLIAGANRGIGLALVREFQSKGHTVIAAARDPAPAKEMKVTGAELQALDVSDAASIKALAEALKGRPIDFLISNAGLGDRADMPGLEDERFGEILRIRTIAPIRLPDALTPKPGRSRRRSPASWAPSRTPTWAATSRQPSPPTVRRVSKR